MFIIREEQMATLKQAALKDFEQRMKNHLRRFFPEECRRAGEERMHGAIIQGLSRAATYGIVRERDVARYIDLSVVLGMDFDSDRRYPWAKEILIRKDLDAPEKLEALLDQTRRERQRPASPQPA